MSLLILSSFGQDIVRDDSSKDLTNRGEILHLNIGIMDMSELV